MDRETAKANKAKSAKTRKSAKSAETPETAAPEQKAKAAKGTRVKAAKRQGARGPATSPVPPPLKVPHRQRVQLGRPSTWTAELADRFIAVLAETCNVTMAARAIRRSVGNVYKHRTLDADFRGRWDRAVAVGYAQLEIMMLERALHGVEKLVTLKSGESRIMREYNDRVALALLRQHRDTVGAIESRIDEDDYKEACERIIERLARLRERDLDKPPLERKGAPDRLKLITLGLSCRREWSRRVA